MSGQHGNTLYPRARLNYAQLTSTPLRWSLPWVIVMVLAGIGLTQQLAVIDRLHALELWSPVTPAVRIEVGVFRAFHGAGPDDADLRHLREPTGTTDQPREPRLPPVSALQLRDGSFNLSLQSTRNNAAHIHGNFTWRLAAVPGQASLLWVCGYAPAPAGARLGTLRNSTDIPAVWLPANCRGQP